MLWNLWQWKHDRWVVHAAYESEADAKYVLGRNVGNWNQFAIAKQGTPRDQYMRDNALVRGAPQNYTRLRNFESGTAGEGKVADHTARGSFNT